MSSENIIRLLNEAKAKIDEAISLVPVAPPPPPPPPAHRHGTAAWFSYRPGDYPEIRGKLTAVRGWISLAPDGAVKESDLAGAKLWKQAGYYVIACVHPAQASSVNGPRIDQWAAHLVRGADGIDCFEAGNECDLGDYWPGGNWREATERYIVPMIRALRERLPTHAIIAGALGNIAKQSIYEGDYNAALAPIRPITQGQAVHPYSTTAADLDAKLKRMRTVYGVPLYATEWDIGRGKDDSLWFADISGAVRSIRQLTVVDAFYRIRDGNPDDRAGRNLYDATGKITPYGTAVLAEVTK